MRIINAFFLALFIYSAIIFGFVYFLLVKKEEKKSVVVYVHQAISTQIIKKKQSIKKKDIQVTKPKKEIKAKTPKIQKEIKTKDNFAKGGEDIKLDDIFSTVSDNIPTTKIKQKKQKHMTKKIGESIVKEIKKQLKTLQTTSSISNLKGSNNDAEFIQNEFSKVWSQIETNSGDFIRIDVNINNGIINVIVIATNLDTIRLNQFLDKIKSIDKKKIMNFQAIIDFKSKLKE